MYLCIVSSEEQQYFLMLLSLLSGDQDLQKSKNTQNAFIIMWVEIWYVCFFSVAFARTSCTISRFYQVLLHSYANCAESCFLRYLSRGSAWAESVRCVCVFIVQVCISLCIFFSPSLNTPQYSSHSALL